ncbi:MAG: hypothetical protein AAB513_00715 [Patescibacteria group bacterium]
MDIKVCELIEFEPNHQETGVEFIVTVIETYHCVTHDEITGRLFHRSVKWSVLPRKGDCLCLDDWRIPIYSVKEKAFPNGLSEVRVFVLNYIYPKLESEWKKGEVV